MQLSQTDHSPPKSYGWYILAASFVILLFSSGSRFIIGLMFKPMIAEFGWDRSTVSLAFFIFMVVYAISITIVGKYYDRYGPKWVIIISSIFILLGFSPLAFITSFWQFVFFYSVIAALGLAGTSVPFFSALMSKWFEKMRGLAISLTLSGNCLGQFILVPLFNVFMIHHGWRISCFFMGFIMLLVNIMLSLTIIKGDPDDLGKSPYGSGSHNTENDPQNSPNGNIRDYGLRDAMRTSSFWLFLVVMFVCGSGDFLVTTHLVPMATDHGVPTITAGNMLAWIGFMSMIGILIAGPASDLIGNKIPIAVTFLMRFFLFILILQNKSILTLYIFSLAFGFTFLITAPLTPTLIGRLYGLSHVGVLSGFITTIHHMGGGFWAYVGGLFYDHAGSYDHAFLLSAIISGIAFLCAVILKEKRYT